MVGGHAAELSLVQLTAVIVAHAGRVVLPANATHCASAIMNHPGGNAAGGALNGVHYKGQAIYHDSRNLGAAGQRCSVFYADDGSGNAKLLAVGEHTGQAGPGHPIYDLDWVAQSWGGSARWRAGHQVVL